MKAWSQDPDLVWMVRKGFLEEVSQELPQSAGEGDSKGKASQVALETKETVKQRHRREKEMMRAAGLHSLMEMQPCILENVAGQSSGSEVRQFIVLDSQVHPKCAVQPAIS